MADASRLGKSFAGALSLVALAPPATSVADCTLLADAP